MSFPGRTPRSTSAVKEVLMLWQISGERSSFLKVRSFTRQNFKVDRVMFIVFTVYLTKILAKSVRMV